MSRSSRGNGKAEPARVHERGISNAGAHSPARGGTFTEPASTPRPTPRVRNRKVKSEHLTRLEGAAARSRAKVPGDGEATMLSRTSAAPAADVPPPPDTLLASGEPDAEQAYQFAKLLRAGVPQPDALCYVLGSVEVSVVELVLPRWMRSRLVVDALATLNGGAWPVLEPDKRLDIALDKHYAEMAHYLYTHDFESAAGRDLGKLNVARESLERLRTGRMEQQSPFMRFLATLLKPQPGAVPALAEARGTGTRPSIMGMVEVVDGEVTATAEGE